MSVAPGPNSQVTINNTRINGFISQQGVANFLGLPYASIPERFRTSKIVKLDELGQHVDACAYGPRCPQPENLNQSRRKHLFAGTASWPPLTTSEFDCLNLNIYSPPDSIGEVGNLPVVVWIHGGGWVFGAGGPEYDGNYLVEHSIRQRKPFVLVTINYRLGYFGFLASRELQVEAERNAEDYCPNQGLYDQRVALQWVQAYVHHFGGNPSSVTVAGQSAGGYAALTHLVSDVRLCHAGWIMSSPINPFMNLQEAQDIFDRLISSTGLPPSACDAEKLARLRNLTALEMQKLVEGEMLIRPVWDASWFIHQREYAPLEQTKIFPDWIRGVTIGWMADELVTFKTVWALWTSQELFDALNVMIPEQEMVQDIVQIYSIRGAHDDVLSGFIDFASDCLYALTPQALSQAQLPISVYRFEQVDDFDESFYAGSAYHCLDNAYLFRLPAVADEKAPESRRGTSDIISQQFLDFVYGKQPWEHFSTSGKIMVLNGASSGLVDSKKFQRLSTLTSSETRATILANSFARMLNYMKTRMK